MWNTLKFVSLYWFLFVCGLVSGPTCRTLRTSLAASTMKCIVWGASMRITQWLMLMVSQNIILLPTRCRRQLPHRRWAQHAMRLGPSLTALHSCRLAHRWDRNLIACLRAADWTVHLFLNTTLDLRLKPSLVLRHVLQLDFYPLHILHKTLFVFFTYGYWPNKTDWHSIWFSQSCLNINI